jgi:hypothetical protein
MEGVKILRMPLIERSVQLVEADTDPLLSPPVIVSSNAKVQELTSSEPLPPPPKPDFIDPLSMFSMEPPKAPEKVDNAAQESIQVDVIDNNLKIEDDAGEDIVDSDSFESLKQKILADYVHVGDIKLAEKAFNEIDGSGVEDGSSFQKVDVYTKRLADLERKHHSSKTVILSQDEYVKHVETLSQNLDEAWAKNDRISSLKIGIQLAKLLADTNAPEFYPIMFVHVIDALEKFGRLVFNRIYDKAEQSGVLLDAHFTAVDVPDEAREICRNWFFKIASVRELVPRVYAELAIFRCYRYMVDSVEFVKILTRLSTLMKGIGDPLVGLYARAYMIHVSSGISEDVHCDTKPSLLDILRDSVILYSSITAPYRPHNAPNSLSYGQYTHLMRPALQWIYRSVAQSAPKEVFTKAITMYRDICADSLLLQCTIESFQGKHYADAYIGMAALIKSSRTSVSDLPITELYTTLGRQLIKFPPPADERREVLHSVWRVVSKVEDSELTAYMHCSAIWLDVLYLYYSIKEVMILMQDLASKVNRISKALPDKILRALEQTILILISPKEDSNISIMKPKKTIFSPKGSETQVDRQDLVVLTSIHLLKIVNLFKGPKKLHICQAILRNFANHPPTGDAIVISTMFEYARVVHDSIEALSAESERCAASRLIIGFIDRIYFESDLDRQLSTYVESRSIFCNLDLVSDALVIYVSGLPMRAYRRLRGRHTKKTAAFAKACIAYCHVTIPSIMDVMRKLELLVHCAQVALMNQSLPQADTLFLSAIMLLPDVPHFIEDENGKRTQVDVRSQNLLQALLAALVVLPGHPEHGPFYVLKNCLEALPKVQWRPGSEHCRTAVYISAAHLLCTYAQTSLPNKLPNVESNDVLYTNSPRYMNELHELLSSVLDQICTQLEQLATEAHEGTSNQRHLLQLALDLANLLNIRTEPTGLAKHLSAALDCIKQNAGAATEADKRYIASTVAKLEVSALDEITEKIQSIKL